DDLPGESVWEAADDLLAAETAGDVDLVGLDRRGRLGLRVGHHAAQIVAGLEAVGIDPDAVPADFVGSDGQLAAEALVPAVAREEAAGDGQRPRHGDEVLQPHTGPGLPEVADLLVERNGLQIAGPCRP